MARPDACPNCGSSTTAHTGAYCHECGEPLTPRSYAGRCNACGDEWRERTRPAICPECHSLDVVEVTS
jgi:predicted amidophosphoribosyltransferase